MLDTLNTQDSSRTDFCRALNLCHTGNRKEREKWQHIREKLSSFCIQSRCSWAARQLFGIRGLQRPVSMDSRRPRQECPSALRSERTCTEEVLQAGPGQ